jgi:hypothetical protein
MIGMVLHGVGNPCFALAAWQFLGIAEAFKVDSKVSAIAHAGQRI